MAGHPWVLIVCKVADDHGPKSGQNSTYQWHVRGQADCSSVLTSVPFGQSPEVWKEFQAAVVKGVPGDLSMIG
jgi:hypothetical protein